MKSEELSSGPTTDINFLPAKSCSMLRTEAVENGQEFLIFMHDWYEASAKNNIPPYPDRCREAFNKLQNTHR